jgi:hypothetical protein
MRLISHVTNIRAPADHRGFLLDVQQAGMSMPSAKTIVVALFFAIGGAGCFWLGTHVLLWWLI